VISGLLALGAGLRPGESGQKISMQPLTKVEQFESLEPDDHHGSAVINCQLLPMSQTISFIVFLLILSTTSWLIEGKWGPLTSLSAMFQFALIPILIGNAIRLNLIISPTGIKTTSVIHKDSLHGRTVRRWDDLHSVRLRSLGSTSAIFERIRFAKESRLTPAPLSSRITHFMGKNWFKQGFILLDFTSGGVLALPLAGLSYQSLENLFVSLSRWADPMTMNPDVIALQRDILTGQELQLSKSYTKMWEESLRQRFEVTNFVPLSGGHSLRNGKLKILMLLACGGMSSVYLARDENGKRFILKEMSVPTDGDHSAHAKLNQMFDREARILAQVDHPNIVKVYDHFIELGRNYLLLEFVPGLTLKQQVQMRGPFAEGEAINIGKQIADILVYLHAFKPAIIHRDLTPDNLIIREPERTITLIDFGAANEFISHLTGTLIGKQCYIPPEQFRGEASPQSDIYALGGTLHFLLTGCDPEPITPSHPRDVNPQISSTLDDLIARATAPETSDRLGSAEDFLNSLRRLG